MEPRHTQGNTMATVVRELERTQTASSERMRELPRDAEPYMTREARAERTAWRLRHLEAWHRDLEGLVYFDPEYAYDVAHEYEEERTTDPDHSGNGIEFCEYSEDGVLEPIDDRRTLLEGRMLFPLRQLCGNRAESQGRLYFPGPVAERLKLRTQGGNRSSYVKPDLMLFPPAFALPADEHRDRSDCALRVHEGAPPPELVVEILSVSSVRRDYGVKMRLYEALGVAEYWICDVGGIRKPGSPVALVPFRLGADGLYAAVPASGSANGAAASSEAPVYWSAVCGVHIRLRPGAYEPRFQWWDAVQGRWRDTDTDAQDEKDRIAQASRSEGHAKGHAEGRKEGREEGRTETAIDALHFLPGPLYSKYRDEIAAYWREAGPPPEVMGRILKVQQAPNEWRRLLEVPEGSGDT